MNNNKVTVRLIIQSPVGQSTSQVIVAPDIFAGIVQSLNSRRNQKVPKFKFSTGGENSGKGVYTFIFAGNVAVDVYKKPLGYNFTSLRDGKEYPASKPVFFINTEQAKACLLSLEEERALQPKRPFDISAFDLNVVATA